MNRILLIVLISLVASSGVFAQPFESPWLIVYQGRFENSDGAPMPAGVYDVIFGFWATEFGGGPPFWSEAQQITVDSDGLFDVKLGQFVALDPANWPADNQIWLALGYNEEFLVPRVPFCAVPFAFHADNVLRFDDMEPAVFRQSIYNVLQPILNVQHHRTWIGNVFNVPANGSVQYQTPSFFVPAGRAVCFSGATGLLSPLNQETGRGTILTELFNTGNVLQASSITSGAANPGSLYSCGISNELAGGNYYVRITVTNTHDVSYEGYDMHGSWQGTVEQR